MPRIEPTIREVGASMAGDWIPATVGLARNRKVLSISAACGRSRHEVVGLLIEFWGWASNETADGLLERLHLRDLCAVIGADEKFWLAVESVGWLEIVGNSIRVPRAEQWLTKGAKARLKKTKRQGRWRDSAGNVDSNVDALASTKSSTTEEKRREENTKGVNPLKPPRKPPVTSADVPVPSSIDTPEVRAAIDEWLAYKRTNGETYKNPTYLGHKVAEFANDQPAMFVAAVRNSIGNNYSGIVRPNKNDKQRTLIDAGTRAGYDPHRPGGDF